MVWWGKRRKAKELKMSAFVKQNISYSGEYN